jgi:hypothetical protein
MMVGQLWGCLQDRCLQDQWFYITTCTYSIENKETDPDEAHIAFGWTEWLDKMWKCRGLRFTSWAILQGDTDITEGFDPGKAIFRDGRAFGIKIPDLLAWPCDEVHICEMDLQGFLC